MKKKQNIKEKIKELRDYTVNGEVEICTERAKLLTEFLKMHGGLDYTDPFTRQAQALYYILEHKKPKIFPGDLLAGSTTSKRKGVMFYPEFMGLGMFPELLSMPFRKRNPYKITPEEALELNDILDYWMDKSLFELVRKKLGDDNPSFELHNYLFLYVVSKYACQSHTIPNYKAILDKGIIGLLQEARRKPNTIFIRGVITVLKGVIFYAINLASEALRQYYECEDIKRKEELYRMFEICCKVPLLPATTFREALQSIWICKTALYQEQNNVGLSIGRIDKLLNQYYVDDIKHGRITHDEALELLCHFWLKIGDNVPMLPEAGEMLYSGTGTNQAITIGGTVNEVTYLALEATELLGLRDPNVTARVNENDPEEYTDKLIDVIVNTGSTPSLYNDSVIKKTLEKTGVSKVDARDYAIVGCVEPNSAGRTFGHTGAIMISLMTPLELVLYNGDSRRVKGVGMKTGHAHYQNLFGFEFFMDSVKLQLNRIITHATNLNNECGEMLKYLHPQPLLSAMMEGCIKSETSVLEGGAKYNSSGIAFVALADLIDSLYVIKKLVYDDKKITLQELVKAIDNNFEGYEYLYNYVINKIDHFGNDVEEVDKIGKELVNYIYELCRLEKNYRGGTYLPGYWSVSVHSGFGMLSGAYPHGKKEGESFASGLTPFSKSQKKSPTATFNSLASLPNEKMPNGMALNMKFNKSMFESKEKKDLLKALIKGYFASGGMQVQFIIQDAKTLIDAKKHPEKYPDLMVRISGYTAYFRDLSDHMKDEIINRAIMRF